MRPPSPPSISSHKLQARLHHWRLRQQRHLSTLFPTSLSPPHTPPLSLQNLRSGHSQLVFSNSLLLICDACAALIKLPKPTASSSASTLSPTPTCDDFFTCICGFTTPVGTLRYLFGLLNDRGPAFEREIARALLVEALGAPAAVRIKDKELRDWMLDPHCRKNGLFRLCQVLGLCEEEVGATGEWQGYDAEAFLSRLPQEVMPRVPFSLCHLEEHTSERDDSERTLKSFQGIRDIVIEGRTLWREDLSAEGIQKMRTLGEEYITERRRIRYYLHNGGRVKETVKATQSKIQSSNREDGACRG